MSDWTLIHGDCLDVLPTLDKVDHVITDPPYVLDFANCITASRNVTLDSAKPRDMGYLPLRMPDLPPIATAIARVCRRWGIVFSNVEICSDWRTMLVGAGMTYVRTGAWVRSNPTPQFSGDRPGTGFEPCTIMHGPRAKGAGRMRWNGGGRAACWTFGSVHGSNVSEKVDHPTPKPLALMLAIVEDFTDRGDLVLDPFAGSGTTGVACLRLGRRFIGIERDEAYAAVARERLEATAVGQTVTELRAGQGRLFR